MINCDTVSAPVEGLKLILVDKVFSGKLPVLAMITVIQSPKPLYGRLVRHSLLQVLGWRLLA
jgi:hypothetical protein